MNSRLVILDANIIIDAFKEGFWDRLVGFYDIHIGAIIRGETKHYINQKGEKVDIDLEGYIQEGKVNEIAATTDQLMALKNKITNNYYNSIDEGEIEALALLSSEGYEEFRLCTGDTTAIKGLGAMCLGEQGISLEELLGKVGGKIHFNSPNYSKSAFDLELARGLMEQSQIIR